MKPIKKISTMKPVDFKKMRLFWDLKKKKSPFNLSVKQRFLSHLGELKVLEKKVSRTGLVLGIAPSISSIHFPIWEFIQPSWVIFVLMSSINSQKQKHWLLVERLLLDNDVPHFFLHFNKVFVLHCL